MKIIKKECGPVYTNGYLVYDERSKDALIIDAPQGLWDEISFFVINNNLNIKALLLTHSHWDHVLDCNFIRNKTNANIYIHPKDYNRLEEPNKHTIFHLPINIDPVEDVIFVNDNDNLQFGNLYFNVIHTPGHTEGGVCYYNPYENIIFTGDTLFHKSIGRTDFPGSSLDDLINSIKNKLFILPENTKVYSGHGEITSIGYEKRNNPFINY
jgi:glyoxylase-like metal-dependent hydrolase (beta-lactamase superfamily II)